MISVSFFISPLKLHPNSNIPASRQGVPCIINFTDKTHLLSNLRFPVQTTATQNSRNDHPGSGEQMLVSAEPGSTVSGISGLIPLLRVKKFVAALALSRQFTAWRRYYEHAVWSRAALLLLINCMGRFQTRTESIKMQLRPWDIQAGGRAGLEPAPTICSFLLDLTQEMKTATWSPMRIKNTPGMRKTAGS